jgi:hypothetical protein
MNVEAEGIRQLVVNAGAVVDRTGEHFVGLTYGSARITIGNDRPYSQTASLRVGSSNDHSFNCMAWQIVLGLAPTIYCDANQMGDWLVQHLEEISALIERDADVGQKLRTANSHVNDLLLELPSQW